jgi:hypothetical protein
MWVAQDPLVCLRTQLSDALENRKQSYALKYILLLHIYIQEGK